MTAYSVWVGGVEANDYYLTEEMAQAVADLFIGEGYDDVKVQIEQEIQL